LKIVEGKSQGDAAKDGRTIEKYSPENEREDQKQQLN
jgi:hypothetical protein